MKRIEMSLLLPTLLENAGHEIQGKETWSEIYNINRSIYVLEKHGYVYAEELWRLKKNLVRDLQTHYQSQGKQIRLTFEQPNTIIIHETSAI